VYCSSELNYIECLCAEPGELVGGVALTQDCISRQLAVHLVSVCIANVSAHQSCGRTGRNVLVEV
jgi:hypothetical protein